MESAMTMKRLVAPILIAAALTACGGSADAGKSDIEKAVERMSAPNSAKALSQALAKRGSKVGKLACMDASATRQRCTGIVDGDVHTWRVDIDLATRTRDFVPTS
jgi:predicted secreted Zn-dependent protease